jgi:phage shock protein E
MVFSKAGYLPCRLDAPSTIITVATNTRRLFFGGATTMMAAPGVVVATRDEVREALSNPKTTVLDVRGVDEILKDGFFRTPNNQWVHAACTLEDCPLLSVAAHSLIRDKSAPILVYCAAGKRAAKAKELLESLGYQRVLNGGGLGDLSYLT